MYKQLLLLLLLWLAGCSTVGNIEALNNTPLRGVREVAHTMSATQEVITGHRNSPILNTSVINSKYGEAKGINNIKYGFSDIPALLQSVGYIVH